MKLPCLSAGRSLPERCEDHPAVALPLDHRRSEQRKIILGRAEGLQSQPRPIDQGQLGNDSQLTLGDVPIGEAQMRQFHLAVHGG